MTHPIVKRRRKVSAILIVLVFWGVFCFVGFADMYYDTFITFKLPLAIFALSSVIGFFTLRYFNIMHGVVADTVAEGSRFRRQLAIWIYAMIIFGATGDAFLLLINYAFAGDDQIQIKLPIKRKENYTSKGTTTYSVFFDLLGEEKAEAFDEELREVVDSAELIEVTYKKGGLGYYVITDYKLLHE